MSRTYGHKGHRYDLWDLPIYGGVDGTDCCQKKYRQNCTRWRQTLKFHISREVTAITGRDLRVRV